MASKILYNSAEQIDQFISGGYIALILRGTGLIRNTGVQDISGAKYFYDMITFVSGLNISGDFTPSGYTAGNLSPKTNNLYDLGDASHEWRNLRIDGTGRIDTLFVDENASISGDLNISGTTYLSGDFIPSNISADFLPKTNNTYSLGSSAQKFKDLWIDGTGSVDSLNINENAYVSGNVSTPNSGVFGALFVTGTGIPTSSTSPGTLGQVLIGSGYIWACTGTNLWGRTHLTGWV